MPSPSRRDQPVDSATIDELCDLLSDEYRRRVLYYLRAHDDTAHVDELREHLSERTSSDTDEISIILRHVTLPKLADSGVVYSDNEHIQYEGEGFTTELLEWIEHKEQTKY